MDTDDNKYKISKLLQGLEVPEVKLSERCRNLVKEIHERFGQEVDEEGSKVTPEEPLDLTNPYKVDVELLRENERKLKELHSQSKKIKEKPSIAVVESTDPSRPWRTNSCKEKLVRIEGELKRHHEKGIEAISPLGDAEMSELVKNCHLESQGSIPISLERLHETVDGAKKKLPNFQYRSVANSTATTIMPKAHGVGDATKPVATSSSLLPRTPLPRLSLPGAISPPIVN